MASYKVIQDIEAEDKFVGPLTFKQFIFAMAGIFFSWVCFYFIVQGISWTLVIFGPFALFGFFMAFPWSKEQPTDVWVLAKIRFMTKPKKRIWNQAGRQDLVTITAPKKIEKHLTKDFSETEVKSRLKALAETIDSRGWVVKHATAGEASADMASTDRLVDPGIIPQQVPDNNYDMPDIMENSSVDNMLDQTSQKRRGQLVEKMDQARQNSAPTSPQTPDPIVAPPEEDSAEPPKKNTADRIDEILLSDQIKAKRKAGDVATSHMSKVGAKTTAKPQADDDDQPAEKPQPEPVKIDQPKPAEDKSTSTVTDQVSPDILNLARNNDLNVATIARQANNDKSGDGDEVVISLH